jgi:hypothetical protein
MQKNVNSTTKNLVSGTTLTSGMKAAATRKANLRAAELSNRANKAWETRRQNAVANNTVTNS